MLWQWLYFPFNGGTLDVSLPVSLSLTLARQMPPNLGSDQTHRYTLNPQSLVGYESIVHQS